MDIVTGCWVAVAAFCAIMFGIGFVTRIRGASAESAPHFEFWMAKRELPGWRLGTSLASGWLMLGWIGFGMAQVYLYGATGLWILPLPWLVLCFIIVWMVPWVRRIGSVSLPMAFEKRFGSSVRVVTAVFSAIVFLAWTQAELFVGGTLMSGFLGVQPWVCMVILSVPVMVYMYMGGFRASVLTDIAQFVLMAGFMIVLAGTAWFTASAASHGDVIGALGRATTAGGVEGGAMKLMGNGWLFPLALLIGYLPGWMTEQDLLLRIQSAPSTKEAMKGAWTGFFLIVVFVIGLPALTAFCAIVAFPAVNGVAPEIVGSDAIKITSAFISGLPGWLQILMLVGIMGCQMSTVDTFSNVAALPIAHDLVDPVLRKAKASEWIRLRSARWISVLAIAVSLGLALMNDKLGDVYNTSSAVLSASIAVPALFIFWKRANTKGVLAGSIVGFVVTLFCYWLEYKQFTDAKAYPALLQGAYGYLYLAAGVLASVLTIVPVSLLTGAPAKAQLDAVKIAPVDDTERFLEESYASV